MNKQAYKLGFLSRLALLEKQAKDYSFGERLGNMAWELPAGGLLGGLTGVGLGGLAGHYANADPGVVAALAGAGGALGAGGGAYLGLQHFDKRFQARMREMGLDPQNPQDMKAMLGV